MIFVKKNILFLLVASIFFFSCSSKDDSLKEYKPGIEIPTYPDGGDTPSNGDNTYTDPIQIPSSTIVKQYYQNIDFTKRGNALKIQLTSLLEKTHQELSYTPGVWQSLMITDVNPKNPNEIIQIYGWPEGREQFNYQKRTQDINKRNTSSNTTDGQRQDLWEREHVFAKSNAYPRLATSKNDSYYDPGLPIGLIAGTDIHNLRPVNGYWNNFRSNIKFADGSGNSGKSNGGWYPGDEWKGDVARMMMYMYVRYGNQCSPTRNGIGKNTTFNGEMDGMLDIYLKWNAEDPVSDFERFRNEYHGNKTNPYSQGNRNPFIDNAYLANAIWGMHNYYKAENKWTSK